MLQFVHASLLDGRRGMTVQKDRSVLVQNGRICKISQGEVVAADRVTTIDLQGRYLMPGLINLHCHLPGNGKPQNINEKTAGLIQKQLESPIGRGIMKAMCAKSAREELLSGTTTIRTVGGLGAIDTMLRDEITSGKRKGARIYAANTAISVPKGHMAGTLAYIAENSAETEGYARKIAEEKTDLIKLMVTGGTLDIEKIGDEKKVLMTAREIRAAVKVAKEYGIPTAAHVQSTEGAKLALQCGVDTIEHGGRLDEETIQCFLERDAALIATFTTVAAMACLPRKITGLSELYQESCKSYLEDIICGFQKALAAGVKIGLGLDNGSPFMTHSCMWRELFFICRYLAIKPEDALYLATLGNAEILHAEKEIGSVEVGKKADFLITEDNPLEHLDTMQTPYMVVKEGEIVRKRGKHKSDLSCRALRKDRSGNQFRFSDESGDSG